LIAIEKLVFLIKLCVFEIILLYTGILTPILGFISLFDRIDHDLSQLFSNKVAPANPSCPFSQNAIARLAGECPGRTAEKGARVSFPEKPTFIAKKGAFSC
jgi:hypothetical protein